MAKPGRKPDDSEEEDESQPPKNGIAREIWLKNRDEEGDDSGVDEEEAGDRDD